MASIAILNNQRVSKHIILDINILP
jgi:hypothetical protein